jgi:hypothetical protein
MDVKTKKLAVLITFALFSAGVSAHPATKNDIRKMVISATPLKSEQYFKIYQAGKEFIIILSLPESALSRSASPGMAVDGQYVGKAISLDVTRQYWYTRTTDKKILGAKKVQLIWDKHIPSKSSLNASIKSVPAERSQLLVTESRKNDPLLVQDPGEKGPYAIKEVEYNLKDDPMEIFPEGSKPEDGPYYSEVQGKIYYPGNHSAQKFPVVLFLHGMHAVCTYDTDNFPPPDIEIDDEAMCGMTGSGIKPIPNYLGYEQPARLLASHGYVVVSISANKINRINVSNTREAEKRGQLVLYTLNLLREQASGMPEELHDRLDFERVGLMGHSRGGEGVVAASIANEKSDNPFGIKALLLLGATNYNNFTIPENIHTATLLPYCDGDVISLDGQRYIDRVRYSTKEGSSAFHIASLMMGANHNYFNTVWTPGNPYDKLAAMDDWSSIVGYMIGNEGAAKNNTTCGPKYRLSDSEQQKAAATYLAAFFRFSLNEENHFLPLFDGTGASAPSLAKSQWQTTAQFPASQRLDLISFDDRQPDQLEGINASGFSEYSVCQGYTDNDEILSIVNSRLEQKKYPSCASVHWTQAPHWSGDNASPTMLKLIWEKEDATLTLNLSSGLPYSGYERLTFRTSPAKGDAAASPLSIRFTDSSGKSQTVKSVGEAFSPLPGGNFWPLGKTLLRQESVNLTQLSNIDRSRLAKIEFIPETNNGGLYLSDVALINLNSYTPEIITRETQLALVQGYPISEQELLDRLGAKTSNGSKIATNLNPHYFDTPGVKQVTLVSGLSKKTVTINVIPPVPPAK